MAGVNVPNTVGKKSKKKKKPANLKYTYRRIGIMDRYDDNFLDMHFSQDNMKGDGQFLYGDGDDVVGPELSQDGKWVRDGKHLQCYLNNVVYMRKRYRAEAGQQYRACVSIDLESRKTVKSAGGRSIGGGHLYIDGKEVGKIYWELEVLDRNSNFTF